MPVAAISTHPARFSVLQAELPGSGCVNVGVLLEDPATDRLYLRLRRDLDALCPQEVDLLQALAADLEVKAVEMGAAKLLASLEDTLSNALRVTGREPVIVEDFRRGLDRLYRRHVASKVLPFQTHLPRYSLQVAAGPFLENAEVTAEEWVETPEDLRLNQDLFVAHIAGHSMEPLIPDGSLCVFRRGVAGSRQGRLLLVEDRTAAGGDQRYTVKRYSSQKTAGAEGWQHQRIHLESLNPGYPSWDLHPEEDKYRVLAEFVRVLD